MMVGKYNTVIFTHRCESDGVQRCSRTSGRGEIGNEQNRAYEFIHIPNACVSLTWGWQEETRT